MLFHIYADHASEGLIKAIASKHFPHEPVFDRSMIADDTCGESERLLKGFAAFVDRAAQVDADRVFVFDLLDRVDEAKGNALADLLQPLFAKGVEIHATSLHVENAVVQAVLAAATTFGYRTIITKSQKRKGERVMHKFTEEEREALREDGLSEELIDSLEENDGEYGSAWRGCDDRQAMMDSLLQDDDPVDKQKVYDVLDGTLRVNARGEVCNVMFRGEDAYFRARVRAEINNWCRKKEYNLVELDEDELEWIDKIQSREVFEKLSGPNPVVLVEQYGTLAWSQENSPRNFLRVLADQRIYGCGNGWCPDDSLPNVLFVVAINDTAKLHWDMNERSGFGVWGEADLK